MTFQKEQEKVDNWIKKHGVRYFNELTNTVILSEEVGEFSSLMARIYGEQSFKTKEKELTAREDLEEEMADILFVLLCLANQMDIKLDDVFQRKLEKITKRDQDRHINNDKLR